MPGEQPATPVSTREVVCLLDYFLTFCLKIKFCQNNKFEKHESSRWKELNAKIYGANIRIFLYSEKCGKVINQEPSKKNVVAVI